MKALILLSFFLTTFTVEERISNSITLDCVLTSDKKVYKVGELPKFSIGISNDTNKDIYLIGSLDGSDVKWRYPYCYFSIEKPTPIPDTLMVGRCLTLNPLRVADFKLVEVGQKFNPYENIDGQGFFRDYAATNKETFKQKGVYKIKFHYSTRSQNLSDFRTYKTTKTDSLQIEDYFKKVPKVEIESNKIEIIIEE